MLILYEALANPKLHLQKFSPGSLVTIYVHWLGSWLVIAIKGETEPQKCDFPFRFLQISFLLRS